MTRRPVPLDARDEPLPSRRMSWPGLSYDAWEASCDTLHAHTQVLGKLAATIAPPEPQLQHAALRITARGWETLRAAGARRLGSVRGGAGPEQSRGGRGA